MASSNLPNESSHPISKNELSIAGIITTIYGLDEIPSFSDEVACVWLLHPRLANHACMEPAAKAILKDWHKRLKQGKAGKSPKGLIAILFDQRNHGAREVTPRANNGWKEGNETHAQDMFSIYHGTALDASLMMLHLPSFLFPDSKRKITKHLVLGVSLGGHAAWLSLFNEPSVTAAVVVIGCPDYARLMGDRAAKCKRKSWTGTHPHGAGFVGSTDFPWPLQTAMERYDPAGVLLSELDVVTRDDSLHEPTDEEIRRLRPIMQSRLGGKRILNLAGGADKLVPYKCSEPFFAFLNRAIDKKTGWFADGGVEFIDRIYGGVGHEFTQEMLQEAVKFIGDTVASDEEKRGRTSEL